MKNTKIYILMILILTSFTASGYYLLQLKNKNFVGNQSPVVNVVNITKNNTNTTTDTTKKVLPIKKPLIKKETINAVQAPVGFPISLNVLGHVYNTNVVDGSTVYDAMKLIEDTKDSNFSFVSKDYSGLGSFVDEINGISGSPGKYWIYYINNQKASVGVSKYVLKAGDIISWKQEEF